MRTLVFMLLSGLMLSAYACGGAETRSGDDVSAHSRVLSAEYTTWPKINAETILRGGEDEGGEIEPRTAVELFASVQGDLETGSVLVKETRVVNDDGSGAVTQLGVMRRVGGSLNGGWAFEAYSPTTMERTKIEVGTCVNCHSFQAQNDYLFSEINAVTGAAGSSPADGPPGF
ncbi:MAG: cytochrome P460 family protein [Myxococcota bacterium]